MAVSTTSSSSGCSVQLKPIEVCAALQDGEKFIKWDEDSGVASPVTLRVDEKGYYLYWVDQNHEMDLLDIATIRDVRTGPYAKIPKDPKLRPIVTMGSQDTLEEKTVTICSGSDFVNVTFINFCCTKKEIAQLWTEELFKMAYNLTQINSSTISFLQKAHTKLSLMVDKTGKIPIKSVVRLFAQNKDDKKKIEKALDSSGLPSGKNETLSPSKFQFEDFFTFYKTLTQRSEVEKVFDQLVGTSKRHLMSTSMLVDFLNRSQRDPRLNEILHPYADAARAKEVIRLYEPNKFNAQKGQLSFDGFLRYLMSEDNPVIAHNKLDLSDDMEQPLSHYFINSSHNTYLTGHQLTGKSSVEIYRQSLLAGCRCVELDFWNSRTEEPVIVHGYTFVPEISAKDVLEAIAESAFKTSEFPVILSFENHCNQKQQAKIANYCREIFGEMLLEKPLESHQLEPGGELPPPSFLRRKIIIKNKKKHHHHHHHHKKIASIISTSVDDANAPMHQGNGDIGTNSTHQLPRQGSKESSASSDSDSSFEEDTVTTVDVTSEGGTVAVGAAAAPDKVQQAKETEAGAEISALVNYVQPVHFSSFENAEKKNRYYEMSSFDEKQATTLLKERPIEFVNYNKHQLSRVYPAGTRFDSSNFMPQVFWNAGCQLVALNYQTLDLAMQLNLGTFEYNRRCGYLLKPEFMRRRDRRLDPFAESTVDGIIAGSVSITVLSGQFLTDKKTGTYVEVDMYGLPADTVRKKFRTRIVPNNGLNPIYGEDPFEFKKVVLPDLASIRLAAYEEGGRIIGHRVLPVIGLCPGYRHVTLRNELNQPLPMASLFLLIIVKDYVPDGMSDFAEALANPIKYQSELEKRERQLAVLTDDLEPVAPPHEDSALGPLNRRETLAPQKQTSITSGVNEQALTSGVSAVSRNMATSAAFASVAASSAWSPSHRASVAGLPASAATMNSSASASPATLPATTSSPNLTQQAIEQPKEEVDAPPTDAQEKSPEARAADEIHAEPLERALECKAARAARSDLRRKLDTLRRKHEKERRMLLSPHSQQSHSKFYMGNKLVKRLSAKNILAFHSCESTDGSMDALTEGEASAGGSSSACDDEALATLTMEQAKQAHEVCERYLEAIYTGAEKYLRQSSSAQMDAMKALLERETANVMRRLAATRKGEVKALAKVHRDRDSLVRVKREVAAALVERGVAERERLTAAYEKRRVDLQRQHDKVRQQLQTHRQEDKIQLLQEYDIPLNLNESGSEEIPGAIPEVSSTQESQSSGLVV